MCGIAGIVSPSLSSTARVDAITRMCEAMVHRGPDDSGVETMSEATLGMRRLAIFDPANGHQPMRTPDGRLTIVFNGAIYNFRALRRELESAGCSFRTECDTEVLLAAFSRWGADCLDRLRGMYAFAVWNEHEHSLFVARDPFGIKPLYYWHDGARFLFGSELNAMLRSGICPGAIDPEAVSDYLSWLAVPSPRTIYRNVFSLRPGECGVFQAGRFTRERRWKFGRRAPGTDICQTREEFTHRLREQLEDTIRAHVIADVPVGAFLSGGQDSAAVVGLMTQVTGQRLKTFSVGFDEAGYSEAEFAAAAARHFGAQHHAALLHGSDIARDMGKLIASLDQPTGDGINTYYASEAARRGGVTVVLSGLGGDELFGGYPSFRDTPRLARWLPRWRRVPRRLRSTVIARLRRGDTRQRKLADFLQHARNIHEVGALQRRVFSAAAGTALLHRDAAAKGDPASPFHPELPDLTAELDGAGNFEVVSAWELRTYMADVLLRDTDVMSMRHSLELRVPLVDRKLVEWMWQQPTELKNAGGQPKGAFTLAVGDILPPGLAQRPKHGFTLPLPIWMKRELRPFLEETFSDESVQRSGLFDRGAVQQLWRGFQGGHDTREWSRVWSLAVLLAFVNRGAPSAAPLVAQPVTVSRPPLSKPGTASSAIPQRTLLLAPEIFASEGGIPRILQLYLKGLCDLSGDQGRVQLVALNDARFDPARVARHASPALTESVACGRNKIGFTLAALRMSRRCDQIVCGHIGLLPVAWMAKWLNPRLRYYLVAHGIEVWRPFSLLERITLRAASKILCVSDYTRQQLLANCPLPAGRAVVLYNGLDPAFTIAPGRPLSACPPVILVVTRLTWDDRYKGVQHMIEALPAIRRAVTGATLRIIGRGDDLERLRGIARDHGVTDAVEFLGFVDDARLIAEMNSCRLFALPSRKEGFGLVFLEAMARGRPCLGARAGGIPEVISSDSGVLVEYGDVAGIAEACRKGLSHAWDESAILQRAAQFSYPPFRDRLAQLLDANAPNPI